MGCPVLAAHRLRSSSPDQTHRTRTGAHHTVALACAEVGRCLRDAAAPGKRDRDEYPVQQMFHLRESPHPTRRPLRWRHHGPHGHQRATAGAHCTGQAPRRSPPRAPSPSAASRSVRRPLYSHAKQPRFQTSAQPSPPVSLRAPRSKQYHSPAGSASAGVGSPSKWLRPMTCSFDAERSFNSYARHLAMNSTGVIAPTAARTWTRTGIADRSRVRMTRRRSSMHHSPIPSCSGHHTVTSCDVQARLRRPRLVGPPSVVASTTVIAWPHR